MALSSATWTRRTEASALVARNTDRSAAERQPPGEEKAADMAEHHGVH